MEYLKGLVTKIQIILLFLLTVISVFLQEAYSQKVGIGTNTPDSTLDVRGNIKFGGLSKFLTYDSSSGKIGWTNSHLFLPNNQQLIQHSNSAEGLFYNNSALEYRNQFGFPVFSTNWNSGIGYFGGKVGIGQTNPSAPLSFSSAIGEKINLYGDGQPNYGIGVQPYLMQFHTDDSPSDIAFGYGSSAAFTETMRIKGNGKVGIGTNNPLEKLVIENGNLSVTNNATDQVISVQNTGIGRAGIFTVNNSSNSSPALEATTNGSGLAAKFTSSNNLPFAGTAVEILSAGNGMGLMIYGGGGGGWFLPSYPGAIYGTSGTGFAIQGSSVSGAGIYGGASTGTGVYAQARGTGNALVAISENGGVSTTTTGNIAIFKNTANSGNVARISNTGQGFFNGGTMVGGADVAEVFAVRGQRDEYEPGDVLMISKESDRTVEKSSEPYSTLVVGVYATKPGVTLTDDHIDASMEGKVPMGVVGVIPTKVSIEGGPITRGDMLVTSSRPGVAMKADTNKLKPGQSIGKALQNYSGTGVTKILVLVSIK